MEELLPNARLRIISHDLQLIDTAGVDVIIAPQVPWLPQAVRTCPRLRWLHLLTAGAERVFEFGLHRGSYWITKSSGVNASAVAEYALGALLFLVKRFGAFSEQQRERVWRRYWLEELTGRRATVLGLGHVGIEIARRCLPFGLSLVGVSRRANPVPEVERVYSSDRIGDAVRGSDVLFVALPLTSETRHIVDDEVLTSLNHGAYLVDVSRGGITSAVALVRALDSGQLAGAALDVFEDEPLPADSTLWSVSNLLLTPHVAGTTNRFMDRALDTIARNLKAIRETGTPVTPVNSEIGY
ncbi:MAG: D-2-hydroxyacid dehydrogenase [Anaerolineales bacterium]|nr:D-2-hydroxyacid dehydrogenase [Anaerolineales bacterium]